MNLHEQQDLIEQLIPHLLRIKNHDHGVHRCKITHGSTNEPAVKIYISWGSWESITVIVSDDGKNRLLIWHSNYSSKNWIEFLENTGIFITKRKWYDPMLWIGYTWSIRFK